MTIQFFLRSRCSVRKLNEVPVKIRLRDGASVDMVQTTNLMVNPDYWDTKLQTLKKRVLLPGDKRKDFEDELSSIKQYISEQYYIDNAKNRVTEVWLKNALSRYYTNKDKASPREKVQDFAKLFDEFINSKLRAQSKIAQYKVIERTTLRYELYVRNVLKKRNYSFDVKKIDKSALTELIDYVRNEHTYYETYKEEIFDQIPDKKAPPKPRGHNTMCDLLKKYRAFFNWCEDNGKIERSPFKDYHIDSEIYGTPIYLVNDETHKLYTYDYFKDDNVPIDMVQLISTQRDIFIFQCNIGCRVSDLLRLTKHDVINDAIEYIPTKTISENGRTVVVPLNETAKAILEKYKNYEGEKLLPFIPAQDYNDAIKLALKYAGINRVVTILNPITGKEDKKPIYEVAASHMARRTFIGNLYKKVQDPNIVASLSGHVEGSRAFSRYREIDTEIKASIVKLLD